MSLISFSNVSKYYSNDLILDHLSFAINENEKVALVGNNGAGKTTILKLILGTELPSLVAKEDKPGEVSILKSATIGYLDQNCISNIENTVEEELLEVFKKQIEMEKDISALSSKIAEDPNNTTLGLKYTTLLSEFEKNRGYTYRNEINEYISRFNFDLDILKRKISSLSGGERMKIAFIKILLFKYNVLLLDEPTNHIDITTIEWLEGFLKAYKGTILFISHDRYFLNSLATKVIELENHQVKTYNCGYEEFLVLKRQNYERLVKIAEKEEETIARYKRFIEFYMPKPRFASRAHDREKKLAKLEQNRVVVPNIENKKIKFGIAGSNLKSKQILKFEHCVIGYNSPLSPEFDFTLFGKDRLAIVGENGVGKTTLVKSIIKEIPLLKGNIKELRQIVNIGYVKQNDYVFENSMSALAYLEKKYPLKSEKEIRNELGRFLFRGEDVYKSCGLMSNGEKMRLTLCALSMSEYDVLLLDEPTNHLDLVTKECLIDALKRYGGAIIFVSHDRYFINQLATHVLYLTRDTSIYKEGNYDDLKEYLDKLNAEHEFVDYREIEKNLTKIAEPLPVKEKLSNNARMKLEEEMNDIELSLDVIDEKFNDPNTKYDEFESINEEKYELEKRYYEILEILEKNN